MPASNKIIVILGPTASGKTKLGVDLACKFDAEIVSADSRQVYKYIDVGSGKDLNEYKVNKKSILNIPYHLIDIAEPNDEFNLAKYQKLAFEAIDDILKRGKLPIIVGGSGLYLQAIVDNYQLSEIKPDKKLRNELEKLSTVQLFKELHKLNSKFADKLNESDKKNRRRLIRYFEVCQKGIENPIGLASDKNQKYDFLLIGIKVEKKELEDRIYKRLIHRLEHEDMAKEVENLHTKRGVSWEKLESFGLEYKFISLALQKKMNPQEAVEKLNIASRQFAKRQMTWFRRWEKQGKKINWIKTGEEVENLVKNFLK